MQLLHVVMVGGSIIKAVPLEVRIDSHILDWFQSWMEEKSENRGVNIQVDKYLYHKVILGTIEDRLHSTKFHQPKYKMRLEEYNI